jgi:MFS family permease
MAAAGVFSLIGATAVVGSLVMGHLSDQYGRRWLLTYSYNIRALGFVVVLLSMGIPALGIPPLGLGTLLAGVLLVGFSWNSIVSVTGAYTSDRYGIRNLGTIYGTMFSVMPIGSGVGAYLGGLFYDLRGTYDIAIWSNIALLLAAMALVSFRGERRPPGLRAAEAVA